MFHEHMFAISCQCVTRYDVLLMRLIPIRVVLPIGSWYVGILDTLVSTTRWLSRYVRPGLICTPWVSLCPRSSAYLRYMDTLSGCKDVERSTCAG